MAAVVKLDGNTVTLAVSFAGLFGGALAAYLSYRASGKSAKASEVAATFAAQKAFMEAQAKEIEDLRRRRGEDREDYEGRMATLVTENSRLKAEVNALVSDLSALRARFVEFDVVQARQLKEAHDELASRDRDVPPDH